MGKIQPRDYYFLRIWTIQVVLRAYKVGIHQAQASCTHELTEVRCLKGIPERKHKTAMLPSPLISSFTVCLHCSKIKGSNHGAAGCVPFSLCRQSGNCQLGAQFVLGATQLPELLRALPVVPGLTHLQTFCLSTWRWAGGKGLHIHRLYQCSRSEG